MKIKYLVANLPDYVEGQESHHDYLVLDVSEDNLYDLITYLYGHCNYKRLLDLSYDMNQDKILIWALNLHEHEIIGVRSNISDTDQNIRALGHYFANFDSLAFSLNKSLNKNLIQNIPDYYQPFKKFVPKKSVVANNIDKRVEDIIRINNHMNRFGDIDLSCLSVDERVVDLDYQINDPYYHLSDKLKHQSLQRIANHLLKLDGYNAPALSIGFCMSVEKLINIDIPDKAKAIRMIFLEFSRILECIEYISSIAYSVQAQYLYHKALFWLQGIERVLIYYTGNIYHLGLFCVGGVQKDIQSGWVGYCNQHLRELRLEIKNEFEQLTKNSLWSDRLVVAPTETKDMISWGFAGANLRSAGINSDFRKRMPFYFYDEITFNVPVALKGSIFDKLLLTFLELEQSFEIIFQVLDNIPTGAITHLSCNISENIKNNRDFELDDILVDGYCFHSLETFKGVLNFSISVKDKKVNHLKIGNDNLSKLNYFKKYGIGNRVQDISLLLRSLNINTEMVEF